MRELMVKSSKIREKSKIIEDEIQKLGSNL
jgi:hypothetical protein